MTDDLVERLRSTKPLPARVWDEAIGLYITPYAGSVGDPVNPDGPEAADRIQKLEEALRPFARLGRLLEGPFAPALFRDDQPVHCGGAWRENGVTQTITFGDFKRAAQTMKETKE